MASNSVPVERWDEHQIWVTSTGAVMGPPGAPTLLIARAAQSVEGCKIGARHLNRIMI